MVELELAQLFGVRVGGMACCVKGRIVIVRMVGDSAVKFWNCRSVSFVRCRHARGPAASSDVRKVFQWKVVSPAMLDLTIQLTLDFVDGSANL